ncbi:MAG: hypothetical protein EON54_02030 [Alcaligenaceae bacterium]|nr:MAG: hypothetical protein EON54_02030 [Alcaligenaceae bacterium]
MIVLRDPRDASAIEHAEIRTLSQRRFEMLAPYDPETMGYFIVAEPSDTVAAVNGQLGFDILSNRRDGIRFDQPGFNTSFEMLEEHRSCYEIVIVMRDDGFGVEVFVPKLPGIDSDLLAMCSMHAVRSQEDSDS